FWVEGRRNCRTCSLASPEHGVLVLCITLASKTTPDSLLRGRTQSTGELPDPTHLGHDRAPCQHGGRVGAGRGCARAEEQPGRRGHNRQDKKGRRPKRGERHRVRRGAVKDGEHQKVRRQHRVLPGLPKKV
ncbi:hypothetical protein T484DRAFT_1882373, partial [Baffinella frigidus]